MSVLATAPHAPKGSRPAPAREVVAESFGQPLGPGSLDHLIGPQQQRLRDCDAECPGSLQVDHQLEGGGLKDGQIARLGELMSRLSNGSGCQMRKAIYLGFIAAGTAVWRLAVSNPSLKLKSSRALMATMVGAGVDGGSPFKAYALCCVAHSTLRYHWREQVVCFVEHAADCPELLRQPDTGSRDAQAQRAQRPNAEGLLCDDERPKTKSGSRIDHVWRASCIRIPGPGGLGRCRGHLADERSQRPVAKWH